MNATNSLPNWLHRLESLHPQEIDLGLERVWQVAHQLLPQILLSPERQNLPFTVITIAGTNGKGSVIAFLEAILHAAGLRCGSYTSPHLRRFNERVRINGQMIDDTTLCELFSMIDKARGKISLTYFEFATLAALLYFTREDCDIVLMEVGLGGRLDAVNILNNDISIITTVDWDHQQWLGDSLEQIGAEKAGIIKPRSICVYGDADIPQSVLDTAIAQEAKLIHWQQDYSIVPPDPVNDAISSNWSLSMPLFGKILTNLQKTVLNGEKQYQNAATAIMVLTTLAQQHKLPDLSTAIINQGLRNACLPGRLQVINEHPRVIVDVAHNPQATRILARYVQQLKQSNKKTGKNLRVHAVFGVMQDKDITAIINAIQAQIDVWHLLCLNVPRARSCVDLRQQLSARLQSVSIQCYNSFSQIMSAVQYAENQNQQTCLVVFGSFYTVAQAWDYFHAGT